MMRDDAAMVAVRRVLIQVSREEAAGDQVASYFSAILTIRASANALVVRAAAMVGA